MRAVITLFLLFSGLVIQAQTMEDNLMKIFRTFNATAKEQDYYAGFEQLDNLAKNNPTEWAPAYYAAWYRVQFLLRNDLKTQADREKHLHSAYEILTRLEKTKPIDEVYILKAYIGVLRMMWFSPERGKLFMDDIQVQLDKARIISPEHPRLLLVEGIFNFNNLNEEESYRYDRAREFFFRAEQSFKVGFTTSYPFMPSWGWEICQENLKNLR